MSKTYLQDFQEKYPNAPKEKDHKTPVACRADVYGKPCKNCQFPIIFKGMCKDCWNAEMKGEE